MDRIGTLRQALVVDVVEVGELKQLGENRIAALLDLLSVPR